jgi:hypothetical protein
LLDLLDSSTPSVSWSSTTSRFVLNW